MMQEINMPLELTPLGFTPNTVAMHSSPYSSTPSNLSYTKEY